MIARAIDEGDRCGYFAVLYRRVTAKVAECLDTGFFHDAERMGLLDRIGARTQTELIRFGIVTARTGAWRFATRLAALPTADWDPVVADRDRRPARVGRTVLHPGPATSTALLLVRARERGDVAANLSLLLATEPALGAVERSLDRPQPRPLTCPGAGAPPRPDDARPGPGSAGGRPSPA